MVFVRSKPVNGERKGGLWVEGHGEVIGVDGEIAREGVAAGGYGFGAWDPGGGQGYLGGGSEGPNVMDNLV